MTGRGEPGGPRISPFDQHSEQYEDWFSGHENAYQAEIRALRELAPSHGQALEVGVGSGRFAAPLGIHFGVDPSPSMVRLARARGIDAVLGVGEALPFASTSMDTVLMVTTVCFLDDLDRAFQEARRVLRTGGDIVLGFVDRASTLGAEYLARKDESVFYRAAHFFTVPEILAALTRAGFEGADMRQTLFGPLEETGANERVEPGHGEGSFVAIRGFKGGHAAVTSVKGERA